MSERKPKFSFLSTSCAGTGGGRRIAFLSNYLVDKGYPVDIHLQMTADTDMRGLSSANFRETLHGVDGDIVVCFDTGIRDAVLDVFMNCSASVKVFYFILWHDAYLPVLEDKAILRIATTSYLGRRASAVPVLGPVDTRNFYPPPRNMHRNPFMLLQLKKCGWVGVRTFKHVKETLPEFMLASLGMDGLNPDIVFSRQMEWPETRVLDFGVPAHRVDLLRFPYSKSAVFVASDSAGDWGLNGCILEAMLCMCPVVSTDWEGFADVVIPEYTALTAPARAVSEYCDGYTIKDDIVLRSKQPPTRPDPLVLCEQILRLLKDEQLQSTLTKQAYNYIVQFDYDYWFKSFIRAVGIK